MQTGFTFAKLIRGLFGYTVFLSARRSKLL